MTIPAPSYVRGLAPYQAGKPISELAREHGLAEDAIVKLASNENPLGVPDSARARCRRPPPTWPAIRTPTASR
jgi:histidinol-phosphate aminotransferase